VLLKESYHFIIVVRLILKHLEDCGALLEGVNMFLGVCRWLGEVRRVW